MERNCSSKILLQLCACEMVSVSHFQCKMWPIVMNRKGWTLVYQDYSVCHLSFPPSCCSPTVFPIHLPPFPPPIVYGVSLHDFAFKTYKQTRFQDYATQEVQWNGNGFTFFSPILQCLQFWVQNLLGDNCTPWNQAQKFIDGKDIKKSWCC